MSASDITKDLQFDRSLIGKKVPVGSHRITKSRIIKYAKAMGETNPLFIDEDFAITGPYGCIIAPPNFYHAIKLKNSPDIKLKFGSSKSAYVAGQNVEYFEPIKAGDTISATAEITSVYAKTGRSGNLVFVVKRTTYTNQHGRTVLIADGSMVRSEPRK